MSWWKRLRHLVCRWARPHAMACSWVSCQLLAGMMRDTRAQQLANWRKRRVLRGLRLERRRLRRLIGCMAEARSLEHVRELAKEAKTRPSSW